MKKFGNYLLTTVLVLALAVTMTACSSGGGSSSGGGQAPAVTYTSTAQAAAATSTSQGAMNAMMSQMNSGMSMGLSSVPAGYAAKFNKRYGKGDIGSIDPTLKMMVEKMARQSKSPMIQKAVKKAASLKAARVNTINDPIPCDSGSATIVGTNNYDDASRTAEIYTYDVTFTNCRDINSLTEMNGTIHVSVNSSLSTTGPSSSNVTAHLMEKLYSSSTATIFTQQTDLNGTFSDIDNITSGSSSGNGTFVMTTPATTATQESVVTFAFTNLSDAWTSTRNATDLSDTDVDDSSGTFSIATSYGGTQNFKFTLGVDLVSKTQYMNDTAGTEKDWLNGTISLSWAPDLSSSGCIPGSISISTAVADPLIYDYTNYSCPVSGTLTINNATVAYGTSSGTATDIIVTVNGTSQTFASCDALESAGGMCVYQ
jgi:hypothetical protein